MKIMHVTEAPTKSGVLMPVRVLNMTMAHALWWDERIQPVIDNDTGSRADRGWRWPHMLANIAVAANLLQQSPRGLVLGVERSGHLCPCAMILLVERYPYLLDHRLSSVFVWYVTRAPDSALVRQIGVGPGRIPKRLMTLALDAAITHSFNLALRGRVGLHASPDGGEGVVGKYSSLGMLRLPMDRLLPFGYRRIAGNDGRYFYHDEDSALLRSRLLDEFRRP